MSAEAANPVVMLNAAVWHIVESGRVSHTALCGRELRERRAHSRLQTIGRDHVCPDCLRILDRQAGPPSSAA